MTDKNTFGTRLLLLFLVTLLVVPEALAGPWPQKRKHGFYKMGFGFVQANRFYELGGNLIDIPTLSDYTVSFYGEYGFTDRITGIAYLPFLQRVTLNRQVGRETGVEIFFQVPRTPALPMLTSAFA